MAQNLDVALVGAGAWGTNFLSAVDSVPGARISCCVDPSEERLQRMKEQRPAIRTYKNLEECLAKETVTAAIVSVPTVKHLEVAKSLLQRSIHVLVEKPLAHSTAACLELVSTAKQHRCVLMAGHVFLFNPGIRVLKLLMQSHALGEVSYVRAIRTNFGPVRQDVDVLWDLVSHDISILNFLFDELPETVSCIKSFPLKRKQADVAHACLNYAKGRSCFIFTSWIDPVKMREVTVVGDRRMLVFDDNTPAEPLTLFDTAIDLAPRASFVDSYESFRGSITPTQVSKPPVTPGKPLELECRHFFDVIAGTAAPESTGSFGTEVVSVLEALDESWRNGGQTAAVRSGL